MIDFPASPTEGQIFFAAGTPQYVFTNGVWRMLEGSGLLNFIQQQFITTSGAITLHPDTKAFLVEVQGGGANGGGYAGTTPANCGSAGGGGGAGGYCAKWITRASGYSASCVIAAATGLSGTVNGNASSYTDSNGVMTAGGGLVGGTGIPTGNSYTILGGDGGVASTNMAGNTLLVQGQRGGWSIAIGGVGFGTSRGGMGGHTLFGIGGYGSGIAGSGNQHGQSAVGYGAGGGGGYASNNYGAYGGGGGGPGLVVITEYR